jgi:hypothetical protein
LYSYPFPKCIVAKDATSGYQEIQRLYDLHCQGQLRVNQVGAVYIASHFAPAIIREGILSRWKRIIDSPINVPQARHFSDRPTS